MFFILKAAFAHWNVLHIPFCHSDLQLSFFMQAWSKKRYCEKQRTIGWKILATVAKLWLHKPVTKLGMKISQWLLMGRAAFHLCTDSNPDWPRILLSVILSWLLLCQSSPSTWAWYFFNSFPSFVLSSISPVLGTSQDSLNTIAQAIWSSGNESNKTDQKLLLLSSTFR